MYEHNRTLKLDSSVIDESYSNTSEFEDLGIHHSLLLETVVKRNWGQDLIWKPKIVIPSGRKKSQAHFVKCHSLCEVSIRS